MSRIEATVSRLREAWEITVDAWQRSARTIRGTPGLLVLSGLLGVSLWVFVTEEENPTRVEELASPVLVESFNVETGLAVANQLPSVLVTLAAPEERWEEIEAGLASFTAFVNLDGVTDREGSVRVQIEIEGVRGVRVVEVNPERVTVNLEDLTSAQIPVRVQASGPLPLGYELGETSVDLPAVTVTGPESLVSRVSEAVADINVTGLTLGVPSTVRVIPRGAGGGEIRGVSVEPSTVRAGVEIRQSTLFRALSLAVGGVDGVPAPGYRVTNVVVSPASVTVEGTLEALQQLSSLEIGRVDITGELTDVTRVLTLELAPGLSFSGSRRVTVVVQIAPIEGSFAFALRPTLVGVGDGLIAELEVETVAVTLSGPLPLLNQLTADDLALTLDVTDLGVGIHDVEVALTVPEDVDLEALQPESVSVTLTVG